MNDENKRALKWGIIVGIIAVSILYVTMNFFF